MIHEETKTEVLSFPIKLYNIKTTTAIWAENYSSSRLIQDLRRIVCHP